MNYRTPAVILGVHYGSLGIARSLGRLGIPVHGVHGDIRIPPFASRYFRHRHEWDLTKRPPPDSVEFLLGIRARLGADAVLIPTSDDSAQLLADNAAELRRGFLFQDNDPRLVRGLRRKWDLSQLASRHGMPSPKTLLPRSADEAEKLAGELGFPLLIKGSDGARLEERGLRKMVIVRSAGELAEHYAHMDDPSDANLMLQEYIPGGDHDIWMFNGYFDRNSACLAGITGRKLRQHPIHTGATSLGVCLRNDEVHDSIVAFMGALGYRGIVDIGLRHDVRDGQYKLLDVNPRIGATFRLFAGADGTDVARLLYLDLTGQPTPSIRPVEGRTWLDEHRDLFAARAYRREGSLTLVAWLRSLRRIDETAWLTLDDLVPAILLAASIAARGLRKAMRWLVHPLRGVR